MGLVDLFLKRDGKAKAETPEIELVDVYDSPGIAGVGSFSDEPICGFDLSRTPYSESGGGPVIRLDGANRRKVIDDCFSLGCFFVEACDYDGKFPLMLGVSFHDCAAPMLKLNPVTPSGKPPKYPVTVTIDVTSPTRMPSDWDGWIDAYSSSDSKTRDSMRRQLEGKPCDSIVGHVSYLPTGAVGKADFYFWKGKTCYAASVRTKSGRLYLSKASRKRLADEKETVTYKA